MRRIGNRLGIILVGLILCSCNPQTLEETWVVDGNGLMISQAMLDGSDNLILGGTSSQEAFTGQLTMIGAYGQTLWSTDTPMQCADVAQDAASNLYIVGRVGDASDGLYHIGLGKYTATGECVWTNIDPAVYLNPEQIRLDAYGNILVLGYSGVAKFDAAGQLLWNIPVSWNSSADFFKMKILPDASGDVYVAGRKNDDLCLRKYAGDTGALCWERTYDGPASSEGGCCPEDTYQDMVIDHQGNVIVMGDTVQKDEYNTVMTLLKYAPDGTLLWQQDRPPTELGIWRESHSRQIAVDSQDNIIVLRRCYVVTAAVPLPIECGRLYVSARYAYSEVVKYDSNGGLLWARKREYSKPQYYAFETGYLTIDGQDGIHAYGIAEFFHYQKDGTLVWAQPTTGKERDTNFLLADAAGMPCWINKPFLYASQYQVVKYGLQTVLGTTLN